MFIDDRHSEIQARLRLASSNGPLFDTDGGLSTV